MSIGGLGGALGTGILSLFSTAGTAAGNGVTASILNTVYGNGSSSSGGLGGTDPVAALAMAESTQTTGVAATAKQPQVSKAVAGFQQAIASATSVGELLQNPNFMNVLLTANGLASQVQYPALARQVLMSDPSNPSSLVNQLGSSSWLGLVNTYQFATQGLSVIQNPSVQSTIANAYAQVTWMNSLNQQTPGIANALSFRSAASSITSVDQILGNSTFFTVVTTALGLPQTIANLDLAGEAQAVSSRLDVTKFQDPAFVERFTQQYLIMAASQAQSTSNATNITTLAVQASSLVA
jgi:hypothetical protein